MALTIAQKIIKEHLVSGKMTVGEEIGLKIDQTLTQDATGTMAYLEFEAMNCKRVKTELSVAYIDHNTLQSGFENADDHRYIQSVAAKYGLRFSRAGNGICHQVHLERFSKPYKTLIGSDSHTPTCGGMGMLAFGAGGLDVAVAMSGGAYYITMPKIYKIELTGRLRPFVSAKDIALEILRLISVKGGVGAIIEFGGDGIKHLTVPERATITNMCAEVGATTSVFPSDEVTLDFLRRQKRECDFVPLSADEGAGYDKVINIRLDSLEPLIACPHSPDNVVKVSALKGVRVDQVCIGSCTNSSLADMNKVAAIFKGKRIADGVSLSVSPGSKQTLCAPAKSGALNDILHSGARLLECACGPCIGMGFSPNSAGVSLRTFNRNFFGRSGTKDAQVYLVSPETAAASALKGEITDPRELSAVSLLPLPETFETDDGAIIAPLDEAEAEKAEVLRGPNIKPVPVGEKLTDALRAKIALKVGDNITTDHIMPAGAKILPYRSNIPRLSEFCFSAVDENFEKRAKEYKNSVIIGGINYGQGSSREHAALVPLFLGVKAVIAKSFARIHSANLINAGIIPLTFENEDDFNKLGEGAEIEISNLFSGLEDGRFTLKDIKTGKNYALCGNFTARQREILQYGGLLNYMKEQAENEKN